MANSVNIDLRKRVVVVKGAALLHDRLFYCQEGSGCYPFTEGRDIFGVFISDRAEKKIDGMNIERLATGEEIKSVDPYYFRG